MPGSSCHGWQCQITAIPMSTSLLYRAIHPCGLDPGSPCRDDGFFVVSYFFWVCGFLKSKALSQSESPNLNI